MDASFITKSYELSERVHGLELKYNLQNGGFRSFKDKNGKFRVWARIDSIGSAAFFTHTTNDFETEFD